MANRNHNVEQDANMSTTARSLLTCDVPGCWRRLARCGRRLGRLVRRRWENLHQNPEVIDRATTAHDSSPTPTAGRLALVDSPAGPEHAVPLQRQRESDRSQPGASVVRFRKFTMRTPPKWTVTRHPGATDKTIPAQYRRARQTLPIQ